MKKNLFKRLAASAMALAMLLPCLTAVPAASAAGSAKELFYWEFTYAGDDTREAAVATFKSNIVNESGALDSGAFPQAYGVVQTEKGPVDMSFQGWYNNLSPERYSSGSLHKGLPYEILPGNYKKITENLKLELSGVKYPLATKDMEALNIEFTYLYYAFTANNIVFDQELQVYVSLDGKTWLEDTVGIRSAELIGGTVLKVPSGYEGAVYKIRTENLFDIEGLNPGDTIKNIMIMPNGTDTRTFGAFSMHDLGLYSYSSVSDFEAAVPKDVPEYIHVGEDVMRQIVVDEGVRTATTPWTTDTIQHTSSPAGSSLVSDTISSIFMRYYPGFNYTGPVYQRNIDSTRELFQSGIINGKHMNGYANDNAYGMDCQTFAYNAISRATRSFGWACMTTPGAPRTVMLGEDFLKHNPHVAFTDYDVVNHNTEQDMYKSYTLAKAGDPFVVYASNASNTVHIRIAKENHVVYNEDGTINGDKSYINFVEQNAAPVFEITLADGTEVSLKTNYHEDLLDYIEAHPGCTVNFGHSSGFHTTHTYNSLYTGNYVGFTITDYATGNIELQDTDILIFPKDKNATVENSGAAISFSSNYRVISWSVKLEDLAQGTVLFEEKEMSMDPQRTMGYYCNDALNAKMANLTNGNYRLSFSVDSGPFTAIGQSVVPTTTATYDFTIDGKAPAGEVTLSSPASASAGDTIVVNVVTRTAADVAHVEIKFDTEALAYVSCPQYPNQIVEQNNGIISIARVNANLKSGGQVSQLTFKANSDIAQMADAIQVKSAMISTAKDANTGDTVKATSATEVCASINYADVSKTAWYHDAVDYVLTNGIMGGYNASTFGPNDTLSRAMVVQVLYNKEGQIAVAAANKFPDVSANDWFYNAVRWGASKGVVGGYGNGHFGPNDNVTIEQVAVILWNYSGNPTPTGDASSVGAHSDWAANALSWAVANGILENVPVDSVMADATRAQTAQMLTNYLSK